MSFEKFTDKARKVLVLAQDEARSLHQPYVGTEHILLGLIQGEGRPGRPGPRPPGREVRRRGAGHPPGGRHRRGHRRVRPSVVHPARQARAGELACARPCRWANPISPPSICCSASCAKATAPRSRCSTRLGVSGDDLRSALNDLVGQSPVYAGRNAFDPQGQAPTACSRSSAPTSRRRRATASSTRSSGVRARSSASCRSCRRRQKNNPLLIGEPGVGKTAVAEGPGAAHRVEPGARHPARQAPGHARRVGARGRVASTAASSRSA